jgi:hypothetical protein
MFLRNPVFTLLAVSALALGIGANTGDLHRSSTACCSSRCPMPSPDRLVMLWSTNAIEHRDHEVVSPLDFQDYKKAGAFADVQATFSFLSTATLTSSSGAARQIVASVVSPGTFEMLGRAPILGRTFTSGRRADSLLISYRFWTSTLGSDPERRRARPQHPGPALDRARRHAATTSSSLQRRCSDPSGFTRSESRRVAADAVRRRQRAAHRRRARISSAVSGCCRWSRASSRASAVAQANAEVAGIAAQLSAQYADTNRAVGASVVPLHDQAVGGMRPALMLVLGGVGVGAADGVRESRRTCCSPAAARASARWPCVGARRGAPAADLADARRDRCCWR